VRTARGFSRRSTGRGRRIGETSSPWLTITAPRAALRNATRVRGRTRNERTIAAAVFGRGIEGRHEPNGARPCEKASHASSGGTSGMGRRCPCNPEHPETLARGVCNVCRSLAGADRLVMRWKIFQKQPLFRRSWTR
jgi:hypothetical protein